MRIIVAEDDLVSRMFLYKFLSEYGDCDMVVDGLEALDAIFIASKENKPYELICLDIMMPKVDGVRVLKYIRDMETKRGLLPEKRSKVIMTSALAETQFVQNVFDIGCDAYVTKPIDTMKMTDILQKLECISA